MLPNKGMKLTRPSILEPCSLSPVLGVFPKGEGIMTDRVRLRSCLALMLLALPLGACDILEAVIGRTQSGPEFVLLPPDKPEGWTCVDFGVAGEPELAREGDAWLIDASFGHPVRTSTVLEGVVTMFPEEAFRIVAGERAPLPAGVEMRRATSNTDTNSPIARHCVFYGTQAQSESAPEAPELVRPVDTTCPADAEETVTREPRRPTRR